MADNGAISYKPAMAWINGGSVRADIAVGDVTMANVLEVVPFQVCAAFVLFIGVGAAPTAAKYQRFVG